MINKNHSVGVSLHLTILCLFETKTQVKLSDNTNCFIKKQRHFFEELTQLKKARKLVDSNKNIEVTKADATLLQNSCKEFIDFLEKEKKDLDHDYKNIISNTEALISILRKLGAILSTVITMSKK